MKTEGEIFYFIKAYSIIAFCGGDEDGYGPLPLPIPEAGAQMHS